MIITRLTGGLGNQMFQYAAGLALAEQHRTVLKLDVSWFKNDPEFETHNRYAMSCLNIIEQFATQSEVDQLSQKPLTRIEKVSIELANKLHFYRYSQSLKQPGNLFYDRSFKYDPEFISQPDFTYLHGNWQSDKYFHKISDTLRLHFSFRYPPQPSVTAMTEKITATPSSAFIHFRRGDYLKNPEFNRNIGVLDLNYYHRAVTEILSKHPQTHFYIFSDDIDAVEKEFQPTAPHTFVKATQYWHSYDKIRLMSQCNHGIIANSTFSWWAAWMIQNSEKTIIAPKTWHRSKERDCSDATPKNWIRI